MPKGGWLSIATRVEGGQAVVEVGDTGAGIPSRAPVAHLRPVLHDQADRTGHGPRPVDHLRHRPGARRRHHLRQRGGQGHAVPAAPSRCAQRRRGRVRGDRPRRGRRATANRLAHDTTRLHSRHRRRRDHARDPRDAPRRARATTCGWPTNGTEGIELARSMPFDAAIVDVMMPGIDGIATLDELKTIDEDLPVIMVTAFASIETAIAAMKRGAFDYITKPFKNDEVLVVLRNAARAAAAGDREPRPAAEPADALPQVRQHHRPQPADAAGVRPDHPGGAEPIDGARQRRERHRQGAGRARAAHQLAARRSALRHASTPATCRRICSSRTCSAT